MMSSSWTSVGWFVKTALDGLIKKPGGSLGLHEVSVTMGTHLDHLTGFLLSSGLGECAKLLQAQFNNKKTLRVRVIVPDAETLQWFNLGLGVHAYRNKSDLHMLAAHELQPVERNDRGDCKSVESTTTTTKQRTDTYVVNGVQVVAQAVSESSLLHLADVQPGDFYVSLVRSSSSQNQQQQQADAGSLRVPCTCLGVVTLCSA